MEGSIVGDTSSSQLRAGPHTSRKLCAHCQILTLRCFAIGLMSLLFATSGLAVEIRIAFVAPLSGQYADTGYEMLRAARESVAKLKSGKLNDAHFSVVLVTHDDQCDPSIAQDIAYRIASDQAVDAVIGHCPAFGHVVAQIYNQRGVIFIATPIYETDSRPWDFYDGVVFRLGEGQLNKAPDIPYHLQKKRNRDVVQAAFEVLFRAIRETGTTDARKVAYELRRSAQQTVLGMLRSGESGMITGGHGPPPAYDNQPSFPGYSVQQSPPVYGVLPSPPVYDVQPSPPVYGVQPDSPSFGEQPGPPVAEASARDPVIALPVDPQWSSWMQLPGSKVISSLEVSDEQVYEFVLDLSPFDYLKLDFGEVAPTTIQPDMGKKIKDLIKQGINELRLKIRPVVIGSQIEIIDPKPHGYDLKLDLTKLEPSFKELQNATVVLERVQRGEATLDDFASIVQAGEIRFEIAANSPGCATIGLSVWDSRGVTPYDHLVRTIAVRRRGEPAPDCGDNQLRGGFATLLDTALTLTESSPGPADVALHIFEFPAASGSRSVAVMVDRVALEQAAKPADQGSKEGVYAWEMRSALSDYLLLPAQLQAKLEVARDKATSGKEPHPYAELAKELSEKIFTPGQDQAQKALSALQQRVSQTDRRLRLLARIISDNNEPIYLPLGLLSASAATPVLAKPVTVFQPLSRERYVYKKTCIEGWTFVIPLQLKGVSGIDLAGMDRPKRDWTRWLETLESLVNYLTGAETEKPINQGEGLLLLAHHDSGVLWFDDAGQRVKIEDFRRTFKPGSVAILAACSTVGVKPENRIIAKELNMMGVDAFIVSPFQVRADYGAQLAMDFAATVEEGRTRNLQPTLVELFEQASQKTANSYRDAGKNLDEMALEFMVLGDDNLKLCPSDSVQRQQ